MNRRSFFATLAAPVLARLNPESAEATPFQLANSQAHMLEILTQHKRLFVFKGPSPGPSSLISEQISPYWHGQLPVAPVAFQDMPWWLAPASGGRSIQQSLVYKETV